MSPWKSEMPRVCSWWPIWPRSQRSGGRLSPMPFECPHAGLLQGPTHFLTGVSASSAAAPSSTAASTSAAATSAAVLTDPAVCLQPTSTPLTLHQQRLSLSSGCSHTSHNGSSHNLYHLPSGPNPHNGPNKTGGPLPRHPP